KRTIAIFAVVACCAIAPMYALISKLSAQPVQEEQAVVEPPKQEEAPQPPPQKEIPPLPVKEENDTVELRVNYEPTIELIFDGVVQLGRAPCTERIKRSSDTVMLELKAEGYESMTKSIVPLGDGEISVTLKKKGAPKTKSKAPPSKRPHADEIEDAFGE